jgi:transcriptional regulator with XRE-family HTH domain
MEDKRKSSGRMASKGHPNPIDVHVGERLRQRRTLLGMTQAAIADLIGLTFQQVQKYERGTNRISSSRLFDLARLLDVPVAYFFEGMSSETQHQSPARLRGSVPLAVESGAEVDLTRRETLELVRAYYKISDRGVRRRIVELARSLAKAQ